MLANKKMTMKKIVLLIYLIPFGLMAQNLVPNGGFEEYSGCPSGPGIGQFDSTLYWINPAPFPPGGSPDYFNECSSGFLNVPNAYFGYQQAHGGGAYCGIGLWNSFYTDFREYIEVPLTTTLVKSTCYGFEMYINRPNDMRFVTEDVQVYFSDTAVTGITNWNVLPFTPQIYNGTGNVPDTLNWTLVSGEFIAAGGEQYLIIGNFKNDSSTNLILTDSFASWDDAFIYIDDVALVELPPCVNDIEQQNESPEINIYPNPSSTHFTIDGLGKTYDIYMYNSQGQLLFKEVNVLEFTKKIDVSNFINGIFLVTLIESSGKVHSFRLLKQE